MTHKWKGLIISLSVAFAVIITAVIFACTLFTVKDIKLDYRTEATESYSQDEIIEKSGLKYGKCVFFLKKNQYTKNIETNFPYLKVINIETVIPSHIVLHLAERQEFYAVEQGEQILICDDEFKVLKIQEGITYTSTQSNAIFIAKDNITIKNEQINPGTFLDFEEEGLKDLYNACLENSRSREEMIASFEEISVVEHAQKEIIVGGKKVEQEMQTTLKLKTFSGREMFVHNAGYGLKYKLQKLFALQSEVMNLNKFAYDGVTYDVEDVSLAAEMFQILNNAELHVKNYDSEYIGDESTKTSKIIDGVSVDIYEKFIKVYGEKDCYFYLEYQGKKLEAAN